MTACGHNVSWKGGYMTKETLTVIAVIGIILIVAALVMLRDKKNHRIWFLRQLKKMWGSTTEREYSMEELESIASYTRNHQNGRFMIDDITWNDLNMDQIFVVMNTTVSSCGEDILYYMLRVPEFDKEKLQERNRLIEYFRTHEAERIRLQVLLSDVKKISKMSITDYIYALKDVERSGAYKYILLACMSLVSLGVIFVNPLIGVFCMIISMSVNGVVRYKNTRKIEPYLDCFVCILRLLKAADGFAKVNNPEIQSYLDSIEAGRRQMRVFRRGAFLVASMNSVQDGLEAFVLSYLKMMFQVDMIKFYSMLKEVDGHEKQMDEMFATMGELDALIAAASFREYLPYYSIPDFREKSDRKPDEQVTFAMDNFYHPLIPNPVANSVKIKGGILITGSNASGKSTFLKTIALNVILAQSILTCASQTYHGDYLKVMTSMALRDDLQGGDSYYMVEIKSLQRILLECRKPEPILCIVDEVLRGTNTIERIAASSRILRSLRHPHVLSLAATHDIELSYILEKEYVNYHFEEEIKDHDVFFSYALKDGRATTRNAIKLLEIIGYDEQIIKDAQEAAKKFEETGIWQ
jgi:DNA mismatch repair ATPase MutS